MDEYDLSQSKMAESAQRVVDRAIEESRRRNHALLTNELIFLAFAQIEQDTFSQLMRDLALDPYEIVRDLEEHLNTIPALAGREMRVAPGTKLLFKLAFHHACRAGRRSIQSVDLFSAIFEESQGVAVSIIRRHGVEPEMLIARVAARMRAMEVRDVPIEEERVDRAPAGPYRYRPGWEPGAMPIGEPCESRSLRERLLSLMGFRPRRRV